VVELRDIPGDPFDRLLIAQARLAKLRLVAAPSRTARYEVAVIG